MCTLPEAMSLKDRLLEAEIPAAPGAEIVEGEASSNVWGLPVPAGVGG